MRSLFLLFFIICFGAVTVKAQTDSARYAQVDTLVNLSRGIVNINIDKADSLAREALKLAVAERYPQGEANASSQLGMIYFHRGNNKEAIKYYLAALKIYERSQLENTLQYGLVMIRLAAVFHVEKDWGRNSYYLKKTLSIARTINNERLLGLAYTELADRHTSRQEYDSAFHFYQAALGIFGKSNDRLRVANIYGNMGINYFYMGRYAQAIEQFKKGLAVNRQLGKTMQYGNGLYNIGESYFYLNNYALAVTYLDSAEVTLSVAGQWGAVPDVYVMKARAYKQLKQLDSTAHYFEKFISLKDSTSNQTYQTELASLQTALDLYKHETENKLLKQGNRIATLYRNLAIAVAIALIALLAFVLTRQKLRINQSIKAKLESEVKARTAEIMQANTEIQSKNTALEESNAVKSKLVSALEEVNLKLQLSLNRAKVDPHFVFNTLNSIQHIVMEKKPHEALDHLAKLSRLMRYVLEKSSLEIVALAEEVNMLEQYIQLEQLRLDDKFQYQISANVPEPVKVPAMLIQPYVENAILHGLSPAAGAGLLLKLLVEKAGEMLRIVIEDNGVGRTAKTRENHQSMGSSLGQKRLDILSKLEQKLFSVVIEDIVLNGKPAGTKVILEIPVQ